MDKKQQDLFRRTAHRIATVSMACVVVGCLVCAVTLVSMFDSREGLQYLVVSLLLTTGFSISFSTSVIALRALGQEKEQFEHIEDEEEEEDDE